MRLIYVLLILATLAPYRSASAQRALASKPALQKFSFENPMPFDLSQAKLKRFYLGQELPSIYAALFTKKEILAKSSFETTEAYNSRLERFSGMQLLRGMTPRDLYAFSVKPKIAYNADLKEMRINLSDDISFDYSSMAILWSESQTFLGSYVGSNSFGVKRTIRRVRQVSYKLQIDKKPEWLRANYVRKEDFKEDYGFLLYEDGAAAQELSRNLRILIIGPLAEPYVGTEVSGGSPTIDNPVDVSEIDRTVHLSAQAIWLYDVTTGEVIKKFDEETFSKEWPIRAQAQCDNCSGYGLDVTVDDKKTPLSNLIDRSDSDSIKVHAQRRVIFEESVFKDAPPKWKIYLGSTLLRWTCPPTANYGGVCTIVIPESDMRP